jgi:acyl-coenzyme A synthetase/AMP-(fatty) acid ligase
VWKRCPQVTTVLQVGGHTAESVIPFSDVLHDIPEDATFSRHPNPATDAALIYFTSGTSGPPKMVLHNQISYPLGEL